MPTAPRLSSLTPIASGTLTISGRMITNDGAASSVPAAARFAPSSVLSASVRAAGSSRSAGVIQSARSGLSSIWWCASWISVRAVICSPPSCAAVHAGRLAGAGVFSIIRFASAVTAAGSPPLPPLPLPQAHSAASTRTLRRDDRADILSLERGQHLTGLETVDDLQLPAPLRARQVLDDDALDDDVGQAARCQLLRGDPRDVRRGRRLLRIVGVEAVLVLDEDRAARAEELRGQEHA